MLRRLLTAILILPFNALVVAPGVLLLAFRQTRWAHSLAAPAGAAFWVGAVALAAGLALAVWTVALFVRAGEGTPAPWDPPRRFVVRGPYRHVRNPMICGVLLVLLGEGLLLGSWPIGALLAFFVLANLVYIPFFEEPRLAARFGEPYLEYRKHVRRWLPRLRPWRPE